jgi:hypothetical protein
MEENYSFRAYTMISMLLITQTGSIIYFLCGMLLLFDVYDSIFSAINETQHQFSSNAFPLLLADEQTEYFGNMVTYVNTL